MSELIDTHCHLDDEQFGEDRLQVWEAARKAGVVACINPGSSLEDSQSAVELTGIMDNVYAAVGVHPLYLPKNGPELEQTIESLGELAKNEKVVAIGEFGFDVKHGRAEMDEQRRAVELQLELARERNLPVIIHCRNAYAELVEVMRDSGKGLRGVVHSFSGGPADLEQVLALGLHVALGGILTFEKGTDGLREAAKLVPADRLLIETDAPYLTPVPRRGQRNTPAEVATVAQAVAELRGVPYAEIAAATTRNARQLFSLPDATHSQKQTDVLGPTA